MNEPNKDDVGLVLNWQSLGESAGPRRNTAGFGTIKTLAEQAISENLAGRILRVLGPVVEEQVPGCFTLRADTDTLAVVLQLLRSTLGLDPIRVLRRRINARQSEAAA